MSTCFFVVQHYRVYNSKFRRILIEAFRLKIPRGYRPHHACSHPHRQSGASAPARCVRHSRQPFVQASNWCPNTAEWPHFEQPRAVRPGRGKTIRLPGQILATSGSCISSFLNLKLGTQATVFWPRYSSTKKSSVAIGTRRPTQFETRVHLDGFTAPQRPVSSPTGKAAVQSLSSRGATSAIHARCPATRKRRA